MFDSLLLKLHLIWSVDSEENHGKGCHQRSDFMAKMHQIRFRLGLRLTAALVMMLMLTALPQAS